jgi:uncharacterized C2H2 Zn-finger protein
MEQKFMQSHLYQCPQCPTVYSRIYNLNRHIQRHHQPKKEMSDFERGRQYERSDEAGARKKSKSRERGDADTDILFSTEALYDELTQDTYGRMMEEGANAAAIYNGQPSEVQTALQNRFLEERMLFQRKKRLFQQLEKEHIKLESVFVPIFFPTPVPVPAPAPAPVPNVAPTAPGLADTTATAGLTSSFGYFGFKA